jgi:phage repressor protein C with HTH and peptisase S24 domain
MSRTNARAALEHLIQERGENYAALSRLIGRNAAYIQQFIKRGTPKKLEEEDRRVLAKYFGVSEDVFGGVDSSGTTKMVSVPRLDVDASAGPGAMGDAEAVIGHIAFDPQWLRQLTRAKAEHLSFIRVQGDSMSSTLSDGDDILVDTSDAMERLRDGIYVLRKDDALSVKRLAVNPATRRVTVKSDNPAYQDWPECNPGTLGIIGRVVWAGRRLS